MHDDATSRGAHGSDAHGEEAGRDAAKEGAACLDDVTTSRYSDGEARLLR
jgi:hypothetical protein